jgi:hypothetical protein
MYTTLASLTFFFLLFVWTCSSWCLSLVFCSTHSIMLSRPADSWITDLTASLASVSSVPSPSDSASGNTGSTAARFVTLGSRMTQGGSSLRTEGEYDGGAKRAHLFLFEVEAQQDVSRVCLGFVGQDNKRFCLRYASVQDPSSGLWFCGVQRHVV